MTQREVAEKLGRKQSYIARVERGKADIQLSSFFQDRRDTWNSICSIVCASVNLMLDKA